MDGQSPRDGYRPRPGDEHVEPLFAGLGVGDPERSRRPQRTSAGALRWFAATLLAGAAALLVWWLG